MFLIQTKLNIGPSHVLVMDQCIGNITQPHVWPITHQVTITNKHWFSACSTNLLYISPTCVVRLCPVLDVAELGVEVPGLHGVVVEDRRGRPGPWSPCMPRWPGQGPPPPPGCCPPRPEPRSRWSRPPPALRGKLGCLAPALRHSEDLRGVPADVPHVPEEEHGKVLHLEGDLDVLVHRIPNVSGI